MLRLLAVVAAACTSAGWHYVEHVSIGAESYRRACEQLRTELAASTDTAIRMRLDIACDNLSIAAQLYGQATALAGDRFSGPADFLSTRAGWKASSNKQYYTLALANTTHFHPYATREWWRYYRRAVLAAVDASTKTGLEAVEAFQATLFEAAFADHFLHDAFAAGHMGFNRAASSVTASLVYHDQWNARGRVVRDRAGRSWKTYGDGRLDIKENVDGRKHVADVSTLSIGAIIRSFVLGARDPAPELEIWRALPYVIDAPEVPSLTDDVLGVGVEDPFDDAHAARDFRPLQAINWPARKDRVVDVSMIVTSTFRSPDPLIAVVGGYNVSLPLVSVPIHIAAGATIPHGERELHFAGNVGITAQLGLTHEGVLDHHVSAGLLWELQYDTLAGSIWAGYLVNIELGRNLIQLQVGPAFVAPENELGFAATLGVARVLSAAGGGVR